MSFTRPLCNVQARLVRMLTRCKSSTRGLNSENIINVARIEKLQDRCLLSATGRDSLDFLQNFTTNDLQCLLKDKQSIYTTFLNERGRVIHDAFIYKSLREKSFLIESDVASISSLYVHLSIHRKLRDVHLINKEQKHSVWVIFNPLITQKSLAGSMINPGIHDASDLSFLEEVEFGDDVLVCYDPRLISLGIRIVAPRDVDIHNLIKENGFYLDRATSGEFKLFRYKLGICEGIKEVLYGRHYPCELNCDYLNGISQKKENFLGLKALKKDLNVDYRLMPMKLLSKRAIPFPVNTPITDLEGRKKKPLGYLRGLHGIDGIAIMRISPSDWEKEVRIGNTLAQCLKPFWWPEIYRNISVKQNIRNA